MEFSALILTAAGAAGLCTRRGKWVGRMEGRLANLRRRGKKCHLSALRRVEHLADLPGEGRRCERLLQEVDFPFPDAMPHDGIVRVARHVQYLHFRAECGQLL